MNITRKEYQEELNILKSFGVTEEEIMAMFEFYGHNVEKELRSFVVLNTKKRDKK